MAHVWKIWSDISEVTKLMVFKQDKKIEKEYLKPTLNVVTLLSRRGWGHQIISDKAKQ